MIAKLICELQNIANDAHLTLSQRNAILSAIRLLETLVQS